MTSPVGLNSLASILILQSLSNEGNNIIPNDLSQSEAQKLLQSMHIKVDIDQEKFDDCLASIEYNRFNQNEYRWFVQNGSSNAMLSLLFPSIYSTESATRIRKASNTVLSKRRTLPEELVERIYAIWKDNQTLEMKELLKHVFYQLGQKVNLGEIFNELKDLEVIVC